MKSAVDLMFALEEVGLVEYVVHIFVDGRGEITAVDANDKLVGWLNNMNYFEIGELRIGDNYEGQVKHVHRR